MKNTLFVLSLFVFGFLLETNAAPSSAIQDIEMVEKAKPFTLCQSFEFETASIETCAFKITSAHDCDIQSTFFEYMDLCCTELSVTYVINYSYIYSFSVILSENECNYLHFETSTIKGHASNLYSPPGKSSHNYSCIDKCFTRSNLGAEIDFQIIYFS